MADDELKLAGSSSASRNRIANSLLLPTSTHDSALVLGSARADASGAAHPQRRSCRVHSPRSELGVTGNRGMRSQRHAGGEAR
jgi:hypothetical protein